MIQIQKQMLNQLGQKLSLFWLILVVLYIVGLKEIVNKKEKHGGGMRQWKA